MVIYPSISCESYRGATNPADLIAGLRACLKSLMALDERDEPPEDKAYYRGFLNRIPNCSFEVVDGKRIIKTGPKVVKGRQPRVASVLSAIPI